MPPDKWNLPKKKKKKSKAIKFKRTLQNLKSRRTETKNSLDKFNSRLNTTEHKINELEDRSKNTLKLKHEGGGNGEKKRNQHQKDTWGIFTCLTFLSPFQKERRKRKWHRSNQGFPHYWKVEHSYETFHNISYFGANGCTK